MKVAGQLHSNSCLLKMATSAPTFTVWCTPGYTSQAFSVGPQCQEVSSVEPFCSRTQQPPPQLSLLKIPIVSVWWHLTTSTVAPLWQDSQLLQLPHKYTFIFIWDDWCCFLSLERRVSLHQRHLKPHMKALNSLSFFHVTTNKEFKKKKQPSGKFCSNSSFPFPFIY